MGAADETPPHVDEEEHRESYERREMDDMERERDRVEELRGGGGVGYQQPVAAAAGEGLGDGQMSRLQRLNPSNPLRIAINGGGGSRVPKPTAPSLHQQQPRQPQPPPPMNFTNTPTPPPPQPSLISLNSRAYTNKISFILFVLHLIVAVGLVGFLIFKGVQGILQSSDAADDEKEVLKHFLPQVEAASLLSVTLGFAWQKAVRVSPRFMVHFILWSSFAMTLAAGILLLCFQRPASNGVGVCLVLFSIGNGLYACWVTPRIGFCSKIFIKSLQPLSKFPDLNHPTYWMLGAGFLWMSLWILAVIGALNFYFPPLIIILLVLSLAWTAEVMRNVANLTVSRVVSLYYLRGMQSSTDFCFQRALTRNLGSACLGSLFVPAIEALRILARGLNLLEGEDEFMFSCAHCCLEVMQSVFKYGNSWAFVQIAAYGKSFTRASLDTWALFESREMVFIVDSDITTSVCFLSGVCSGSICVIVVAAWTATAHKGFTATISLLAFFVGYLMTRIAMALPHACVCCYYVCYADNPHNRLFDETIPERLNMLKSGRDVTVATPRVPRRFAG
ncbi:CTL-like protein [Drosera capensis]